MQPEHSTVPKMNLRNYSREYLEKIAISIKNDIFNKIFIFKTNVFFCGGSIDEPNSMRPKLDFFLKTFYSYKYNIIFPEDLFEELLVGKSEYDLLSLENILAESVDSILIIPESPGSFTELGAFVNSKKLRKKVVCVQDILYKKKKSFINYGPIKLIRSKKEGQVVFLDFAKIKSIKNYFIIEELYPSIHEVIKAINRSARTSKKKSNISNILQTGNFILPCIYLLEPVHHETLIYMVRYASRDTLKKSRTVVISALNSLIENKLVTSSPDGYRLTGLGIQRFQRLGERKKHGYYYSVDLMDKIRIDILAWELRGKKIKIN